MSDDLIERLRREPKVEPYSDQGEMRYRPSLEYRAVEEIERLRAENARMVDMLNWAYDKLEEINISNYDHDDVFRLNAASVEVILGIAAALQTEGERNE